MWRGRAACGKRTAEGSGKTFSAWVVRSMRSRAVVMEVSPYPGHSDRVNAAHPQPPGRRQPWDGRLVKSPHSARVRGPMSDPTPVAAAPEKLSWYRRLYLRVEALSSTKHAL